MITADFDPQRTLGRWYRRFVTPDKFTGNAPLLLNPLYREFPHSKRTHANKSLSILTRSLAIPVEVAADFDLPLTAVLEAIEYCKQNLDVLEADRRMEDETFRKHGLDQPPHVADIKRDP